MNNVRLQRILISVSLVTQVFGFATLGSLMALRGGPDSGARIGGLLAVLTGTMFLVAAIAYWRTCHRQTGQHLGVTGTSGVWQRMLLAARVRRRRWRRSRCWGYVKGSRQIRQVSPLRPSIADHRPARSSVELSVGSRIGEVKRPRYGGTERVLLFKDSSPQKSRESCSDARIAG
jgi:hypothetical protein